MGEAIGKEGGDLISEGVLSAISFCSVNPTPNLSICHRCGLRFPINGSVDWLKTFDSQWRVVLLCQQCFSGVRSAQVCSYCFLGFSELKKRFLDCNMCARRVHRACVPLHHRNFSHSQLDAVNFICVDCCPIPQFRGKDPKISEDSTSRTGFRVSLEDLVRGENSISETKVTSKSKAMENAAKKVMVARGSLKLKRKAFDVVRLVKKPSFISLKVPDEKMAFRLHQAINRSQRIPRSLSPKGLIRFNVRRKEQWTYNSIVRVVESNFRAHHEVSTENKSLIDDGGNSEPIMTYNSLFKQESWDLMKQIRGCYTGCLGYFSSKGMERSVKFSESTDDGSSAGSVLLLCHSLNTWLNSTMQLTKYRYFDCDGEGSSKLKRKSIDVIGPDWSMNKYFGKLWGGSGRIMLGNSHAILTNSPLFMLEDGYLMEKNRVCITGCLRDFSSLKESSLKFPDCTNDGNNAGSTFLPCRSLNTWLNSTMPLTRYIFGDCDGEGSSKLLKKSIDAVGRGRSMKKYFRNHFCSGRIMQGNSHSILNNPLFKRRNRVMMEQTRGWNTGSPGDFSLKEENSLKFLDSTDDVSNAGSTLLPCHSLNAWLNTTMPLTKYRFGDGDVEGSYKMQRKSIDAMSFRYMKKYFRKRWSSKRVMQGNSQSILTNGPLFKKENEDLIKQIRGCNTCCPGDFSLKEKVSSLNFPDSTNYGSNAGSALLLCHSLNTWPNSTMPLTKFRFGDGDGERSSKMQRKNIDAIGSDMKKYYRKRWGSRRIMQGNSQSVLANSPLFMRENGDTMKQTMGCNRSCPGALSFKEKEISLMFPNSTDDDNNTGSGVLPFHSLNSCLNSTMPLTNYRFDDGHGEEYSKLQRRSIDAIGSDKSIKKYFRKHWGSGRILQGNNM